jgi:hypothetical protein
MVQVEVQVDAWYRLVIGSNTYLVMVCGDLDSCLVEACVCDVEHMVSDMVLVILA